MNQYKVAFQPWDASWLLAGLVGANGKLVFQTARDAASHAGWRAKTKGGTIKVNDKAGDIFKTIEIEAEVPGGDACVLPSV